MKIDAINAFINDLERLCGHQFDLADRQQAINYLSYSLKNKRGSDVFGFRQLNELLLLFKERIVSKDFFRFLAGGDEEICFGNFEELVNDFRKLAMLQFGSFRFAFNYLRNLQHVKNEFGQWVRKPREIEKEFKEREEPLIGIKDIDYDKLHLLGYISGVDATDEDRQKIRQIGTENFNAYLTYDFLDVYVATSMRKKWEFQEISRLCNEIFQKSQIKKMNVRYFDPTLSYNDNSIAKGLIEGLMLKRAKCTLYLVQEFDTLGKDSELATTLAQGKPVIAYVPNIIPSSRVKELRKVGLQELLDRADYLSRISSPSPEAAKINEEIQEKAKIFGDIIKRASLVEESAKKIEYELIKNKAQFARIVELIADREKIHYDERANTLMKTHPLRFQIDLLTGVANGVLVTRTPKGCVDLIYKVLTNRLVFDILEAGIEPHDIRIERDPLNHRLIEKQTKCAFRVVTKDEMLTNSFWNLYKL